MPRYRFVDTYEFSYFIDADDEDTAREKAAAYDSTDIGDGNEVWVDTRLTMIETPIDDIPVQTRSSYGPDLP